MGYARAIAGTKVNGADLIGCQVNFWNTGIKPMFLDRGVVKKYDKNKGYLVESACEKSEKFPEGWFWKWRKRSDLFYYPKTKI